MSTQPISDPHTELSGTAETMTNIIHDAEELAKQQRAVTQEMQRIHDRCLALLDHDLGLQRASDAESVMDLIAAAMTDLAGNIAAAQGNAAGIEDVAGTISGAWRLLEVHKANDHITVRKTAKQVRQSCPVLAEEMIVAQAWLNDQPSSSLVPSGSIAGEL